MTYMKLDQSIKDRYTLLVMIVCALFSMLNFSKVNLLQGLWELVGAIVCPLIIIVLPSCFYHRLQKDLDPKKRNYRAYFGAAMAIFGLIILPCFMTLATKNLFEGNQAERFTSNNVV